jgi:hypothetical protein
MRELTVYLGSPGNQMHASYLGGVPVLLSYATWSRWVDDYAPSFGRLVIDSGAFSELNSGVKVDGGAYREWCARWGWADAVAGLDDISGDWRRSLKNYELYGGFPTFHETDPPELLDDLIPIARERGGWLGFGMLPETRQRRGGGRWLDESLDRIPPDLHAHGWALRGYLDRPRLDSVDSTNWFRDAFKLRVSPLTSHLTPAECVEVVVKRYRREGRAVKRDAPADLFTEAKTP